MVKNGWPDTKVQVPIEARPYWTFRDEVATADGLLFKGTRLIVPKSLRPEMLRQIHKSHLGIVKCRQRAREVLFWPGMSVEIEQMVTNCSVCADYAKKQPSELLKHHHHFLGRRLELTYLSFVENIIIYFLCASAADSSKSQS